jgi:hypothetical protein
MDGKRVEMGPGEVFFGEDQNTKADVQGHKGHFSGTILRPTVDSRACCLAVHAGAGSEIAAGEKWMGQAGKASFFPSFLRSVRLASTPSSHEEGFFRAIVAPRVWCSIAPVNQTERRENLKLTTL